MHRAYQPLLPATNKYLKEKWDGDDLRRHRRKASTPSGAAGVAMATPVVDTKGFVTPGHLQVNLKKIQRKKERQAVTDRDNLLLSTRLAEIGNSKGRVDNWNNYAERSLNSEKRRRDMSKITLDNGKILERIEKRESEYRREKWEQHWERVEHIRDDIARYPRGTWLRRIFRQ
ncbi:hypothetical protein NDU88_006355 [Pleurodeles waltl]|uniref:Uncharacterized protein n=1 Tax=Pleurodeles waltl TaxID=8319 RepID=A0AAV7TXF7_PLEWA|nr:hypothetical protein NDU88_006355 [Pleurodeles waltl]